MKAVIEQITPHHPKARKLLAAATEEAEALYPPVSRHHLAPEEAEEGVMVVAWVNGDAVACGVLRPLEPGVGEIKRMFVDKANRRQGLARRILGELEALAPKLGFGLIRLETGTCQPEAIALYQDQATSLSTLTASMSVIHSVSVLKNTSGPSAPTH